MSLENIRYDAFISYRHCELDSFISENLHKKLESYKMPSSVVKKLGTGRRSVERIFRDEAELPLSGNLSDPITAALSNSDYLIVICTPRLRESKWCLKEIETFVKTHDREHVLLVLAEGEPGESFPELLLSEEVTAKDENGNDITVTVEREPLAADCRADNNRERLKLLDNVVLKLYAAIFGLNYDDLRQRHRQREVRRRLAIASAAFFVVTLFAITCLGFMLKIRSQSKVIADKYAGAMASASKDLMSKGLSKDAVYAARCVLPENSRAGFNEAAYGSLVTALAPYETASSYYPYGSVKIPDDIQHFSQGGGNMIIARCDGYSLLIDSDTSKELLRIESDNAQFFADGVIYMGKDGSAILTDTGNNVKTLKEDAVDIYSTEDAALVFTFDGISIYYASGRSSDLSLGPWWTEGGDAVEDVYFSNDGRFAAFALSADDGIHTGVIDLEKGRIKLSDDVDFYDEPVIATDGETLYMYHEEDDGTNVCGYVTATDIATQTVTAARKLSGYGFYDIFCNGYGEFIVSDTFSYMLDKDLEDIDVESGYMDAVCTFGCDDGYVILDRAGSLFTSEVLSTDARAFELYAHDEGTVSHACYDSTNDRLFIHYKGTARISIYERLKISGNVVDNADDSRPANKDDECITVISRYDPGRSYSIKQLSYEDMIKTADNMLDGYVPDPDIRDRYSIN